jgi:hypothetical protein
MFREGFEGFPGPHSVLQLKECDSSESIAEGLRASMVPTDVPDHTLTTSQTYDPNDPNPIYYGRPHQEDRCDS